VRLAWLRAEVLVADGKGAEAADAFSAAGSAAEGLGWLFRAEAAFQQGGNSAIGVSDFRKAIEVWKHRVPVAERRGNPGGVIQTLRNMGLLHMNLSEYTESLACIDRAIKVADESGKRAEVASCHNIAGEVLVKLGRYEEARARQDLALALMEKLGDGDGVATVQLSIGVIHRMKYEYEEAYTWYAKALAYCERTGDRHGEAVCLGNIGVCRYAQGSYDEAVAAQERALAIHREMKQPFDEARALGNLALVHQKRGDYARSMALQEACLELSRKVGNRSAAAMALGNLGNLHYLLGDPAKARRCQEEALKAHEEIGEAKGILRDTVNLGAVLEELDEDAAAEAAYRRCMALAEKAADIAVLGTCTGNLAALREKAGDLPGALEFGLRALALRDQLKERPTRALAVVGVADTRRKLGETEKALALLDEALAEAVAMDIAEVRIEALRCIALCQLAAGRPEKAAAAAREGVLHLSRMVGALGEEQGARAREKRAELFQAGAEAAAASGDAAGLCFFLESGRAMSLLESMGGRRLIDASVLPADLRDRERKARAAEAFASGAYADAVQKGNLKEIADRRKALDAAGEEVRAAVEKLRREAKALAGTVYPVADSPETIRSRLRPGECLVLFAVLPSKSLALVLSASEARIVPLGPTAALEAAVAAFQPSLPGADPAGPAARLRELAWTPLALPAETRRVLLCPDGALAGVPFAALDPSREFVHVPSGTAWGALVGESAAPGKGVLALGDPAYPAASGAGRARGEALPPLPATKAEAKAVGTEVLLGADATKANLLAKLAGPRRRAVHLACHGKVDASEPLRSWLALSPAGDDDGLLTVLDVFGLRVPADLVSLSACETGRGKVFRAEGIFGFSRAFMVAGAPRVLVSLWKVDDEATRALMEGFYRRWNPPQGKGLSAAASLRGAQEEVRSQERWRHPSFWAAWQLWGLGD
jgi:tetratricopeptide (TPR) repeat protein